MVSVKFKGLNTDKLLREIKRDIEKDLKRNPKKALGSHIGNAIEGTCAKCGKTTIKILPQGMAKCTRCGSISKVALDITYK